MDPTFVRLNGARRRWKAALASLLAVASLVQACLATSASAADAHDGASSDCVSSRGRLKGKLESSCFRLQHGGLERTYRLYLPLARASSPPLVLVLHGGGGSGAAMELLTQRRFNRAADRDGAVVVYPDGIDRSWNDGRDLDTQSARDNVDDVGYLQALVARMADEFHVDRARVYATGISNGGLMSYRLACDAAETFAAVAPVTASFSEQLGPRCQPARPVAVAIFNGTADPLVPWAGGKISVLGFSRGKVWSTADTFARWIVLDGCPAPVVEARVDRDPADETALIVHRAGPCRGQVELRLYEIEGGGHTWPMGATYAWEWLVGRVSREVDAVQEIWDFFRGSVRTR